MTELLTVWVGLWVCVGAVWGVHQVCRWLSTWKPSRTVAVAEPEAPPPALTKAEKMAAARLRYEETLAILASSGLDPIELEAAKLKAKQDYLKAIDELMR